MEAYRLSFGSLSKQRGNFGGYKLCATGVRGEARAGELMVEDSTGLFTCKDTVLGDIHSNDYDARANYSKGQMVARRLAHVGGENGEREICVIE